MFIAVPLSQSAKDAVTALVDRVRARAPGTREGSPAGERAVRWVRMEGLHLTLRFIGPTEEDRLDALREATRRSAAATTPFEVRLAEAGTFPNPHRPRTLWLGATEGVEGLLALNDRVDGEVERAGWTRDPRPFKPHLTLARSDGIAGAAETARILVDEARELDVRWLVDRVVLFESITGGGPARYDPLLEVLCETPPPAAADDEGSLQPPTRSG